MRRLLLHFLQKLGLKYCDWAIRRTQRAIERARSEGEWAYQNGRLKRWQEMRDDLAAA